MVVNISEKLAIFQLVPEVYGIKCQMLVRNVFFRFAKIEGALLAGWRWFPQFLVFTLTCTPAWTRKIIPARL
jgi:hypothetical protein